jgi:6-pyruvoyl-tetrahydropterin synthase
MDESIGWICDHKCMSEAMNPLIELMDHGCLNDFEGLENPTIENMCLWFWRRIESRWPRLLGMAADGIRASFARFLIQRSAAFMRHPVALRESLACCRQRARPFLSEHI